MADRRVKVDLVSDVSRYKSGMLDAAASTKVLGDVVDDEMSKMDSRGEAGGGLLARGIHNGIMRNSPLIVAGIGAGLAFGAPAMLAGAGALFAGLGAAAAAQTAEVREAWSDLGTDIKAGALEDAAVLVPVFAGAADKIGAAYQRLRPEIRDAFVASAPLIDTFTDSLTRAAELAMPGLVHAVEAGGPVIDGLGVLMERLGQGVSDFFDALAENPQAAGDTLAALGDILGELLPLMGSLLGTGTELASAVLPPLAAVLGDVASAAESLGPLLPIIVTSFAGMKIGNSIADMLGVMATRMESVGMSGGRMNTAMTGAASGLRALGGILPVAGAALAAWNQHVSQGEERTAQFQATAGQMYDLIAQGGGKADIGARGIEKLKDQIQQMRDAGFNDVADQMQAGLDAASSAADRAATSQENLASQTKSATQAMADQAAQALAASNSELGYQQAIDDLQGSQESYTAALQATGAASEETSDASLALAQSVLAAAAAAGQMAADSLPATTSELERTTTANQGTLQELYRLRDTMGSDFPAAAANTIARLEASGVVLNQTGAAANGVAQDMSALGLAVTSIPGQHFVHVEAPTDDQKRRLQDLGYQVINLPDGDIYVAASTADANAAIDFAARPRYSTIYTTTVNSGTVQRSYDTGVGTRTLGAAMQARGGIVHAFAGGGFEPMRAGAAQIVPPNTWRVIGDRVSDDEAYIPINGSARSRSILEQTAQRMGYGGGVGSSGSAASSGPQPITIQMDGATVADLLDGKVITVLTAIDNRQRGNPA